MDEKISTGRVKEERQCKKIYRKPTLREFGSLHMTTQGSRGGMEDGGGGMGGSMGMVMMNRMNRGFFNRG